MFAASGRNTEELKPQQSLHTGTTRNRLAAWNPTIRGSAASAAPADPGRGGLHLDGVQIYILGPHRQEPRDKSYLLQRRKRFFLLNRKSLCTWGAKRGGGRIYFFRGAGRPRPNLDPQEQQLVEYLRSKENDPKLVAALRCFKSCFSWDTSIFTAGGSRGPLISEKLETSASSTTTLARVDAETWTEKQHSDSFPTQKRPSELSNPRCISIDRDSETGSTHDRSDNSASSHTPPNMS